MRKESSTPGRSNSELSLYCFIFLLCEHRKNLYSIRRTGKVPSHPSNFDKCYFHPNRFCEDGTVLKNYAHCFAILMRLRQLCLHPVLCASAVQSLETAENILRGEHRLPCSEYPLPFLNQRPLYANLFMLLHDIANTVVHSSSTTEEL